MTLGSLYAGIGGIDLGFDWAGFSTAWQVEIDEWKRSVLAEIAPGAERFGDVRDCGEHNLRRVNCIAGGIPCQPFSTSGSRRGVEDDRYLWPEMLRVVRAIMPAFVLVENVAGLAHEFDGVLEQICADLEAAKYEVLPPLMVPLASFGSWHRRDRVWILAHSDEGFRSTEQEQQQKERPKEFPRCAEIHADDNGEGWNGTEVHARRRQKGSGEAESIWRTWWDSEPAVGRMVHGISSKLDRRRVEALGEAVSPIAAQWIAERIKAVMEAQPEPTPKEQK